jgi:hypothetical protein
VPKHDGEHLEEDEYRSELPGSEMPKPPHQEQQMANPQLKRHSVQVEPTHQENLKHRSCSKEEPGGIPGQFPVLHLEEETPYYGS